MIVNSRTWRNFERNFRKKDKVSFKKALRVMDELYLEAKALGKTRKDPLEGIEVIIRVAKVVNSV